MCTRCGRALCVCRPEPIRVVDDVRDIIKRVDAIRATDAREFERELERLAESVKAKLDEAKKIGVH